MIGCLGLCMGIIRWRRGNGAFAEFVVADGGLCLGVPMGGMRWGEAAAWGGIAWGTLGLALWDVGAIHLFFLSSSSPAVLVGFGY